MTQHKWRLAKRLNTAPQSKKDYEETSACIIPTYDTLIFRLTKRERFDLSKADNSWIWYHVPLGRYAPCSSRWFIHTTNLIALHGVLIEKTGKQDFIITCNPMHYAVFSGGSISGTAVRQCKRYGSLHNNALNTGIWFKSPRWLGCVDWLQRILWVCLHGHLIRHPIIQQRNTHFVDIFIQE